MWPFKTLTPQEWRATGQTFDWHGHSIFFRDEGHGEHALLLIHGFPTASWDFAELWPHLRQRFARIVAPDMLGFGFSDKPANHAYTLMEQADLHEALLKQLGIRRIHILAHNYGVSVAQELLARHLERATPAPIIASVALLNGGLFPETHRMTLMQRLLRSPLGPLLSAINNPRRFAKSFSLVFGPWTKPDPRALDHFWSLIAEHNGHHILHRLIAYIDERRRHRERWVGALQKTPVPLRLINGPEDPVSGAHMAQRYRELVPNPDIISLDGIGHYPQVEAPQRVLKALAQFYERIRA